MDPIYQFASYVGIFVGGIIALKVFFSLWACVERYIHPDKVEKAAETSFRAIKNKKVDLYLKDGKVLESYTYRKTIYFDTTEEGCMSPVYFALLDSDGHITFIAGSSVTTIRCKDKA